MLIFQLLVQQTHRKRFIVHMMRCVPSPKSYLKPKHNTHYILHPNALSQVHGKQIHANVHIFHCESHELLTLMEICSVQISQFAYATVLAAA